MTHKHLGDFTTDSRVLLLSAMALVTGCISAFVAYALVWLIAFFTNLSFYGRFSAAATSPSGHHLGFFVVLIPAIGGLIIGIMARYGSPKIRGHGIPEALEAILIGRSRIEPKVAILKPLSSAISIGTGGPFGAEGPIIMTGGAFGSIFAQFFHLSAAERKTLLVAGAAAGMSAIFATPVAAVFLAVELLLFEWKPRSLIPVACASSIAAVLRVPLLGTGPIFAVIPHAALTPYELMFAVLVGLLAGLASGVLTGLVYLFEDLFMKLPIHWMWWPTLGGLCVGIGGLIDPRTLGVGYDIIHELLRGDSLGGPILLLLIVKGLIWSISLGSGTSGGVLAPLLMMGAALGVIEAHWIPAGNAEIWAAISMAAMMGGTMRSPLTALVFTLELTYDLRLMPALLVGCIAAHAVTVLLLRRSILTEKVARRGLHLTREYMVDPFQIHRVKEIMRTNVPTISAETSLIGVSEDLIRRQNAPIVDKQGRLVGILTQGDILKALDAKDNAGPTVLDAGSRDLIVTHPEETVSDAVNKMLHHDIGRLPVVSPDDPHMLLGYLDRSCVMSARIRWYREEHDRESGWFSNPRQNGNTVANTPR